MFINAVISLHASDAIQYVAASAAENEIAGINLPGNVSIGLAQQAIRAPVYHITASFKHDENPSFDAVESIARRILGLLRLPDSSAFIAMHRDKEHPHVHIIAECGKGGLRDIGYSDLEIVARFIEYEFKLRSEKC